MKRETLEQKIKISNDIMFYIYTNIDTDINMDELAKSYGISKFYMHKIFKEVFDRNIYESIKSIRLQKASNLLLTNKYSTISEIANACGYSSQTSFIRAFKERFSMTPKVWRSGGFLDYSNKIVDQTLKIRNSIITVESFDDLRPTIVKMPEIKAYYIRHQGYNDEIRQTWQKLQTWIYTNNLESHEQISLF
ncbi:MAG: helix-turn-helix domain-containing protein, partial [Epsilonproteobacteria bacterium]|nr:helix-turn-helix domain-containing protein [Campylobacterota bacterium]